MAKTEKRIDAIRITRHTFIEGELCVPNKQLKIGSDISESDAAALLNFGKAEPIAPEAKK